MKGIGYRFQSVLELDLFHCTNIHSSLCEHQKICVLLNKSPKCCQFGASSPL